MLEGNIIISASGSFAMMDSTAFKFTPHYYAFLNLFFRQVIGAGNKMVLYNGIKDFLNETPIRGNWMGEGSVRFYPSSSG